MQYVVLVGSLRSKGFASGIRCGDGRAKRDRSRKDVIIVQITSGND